MSATSFGNGSALMPWKDRVQSTLSVSPFSPLVSSSSGLSASPLLYRLSVVGSFGVGSFAAAAAVRAVVGGGVAVDVDVDGDEGVDEDAVVLAAGAGRAGCVCR